MQNELHDEWVRQMVANMALPTSPTAAVADRVLMSIRAKSIDQSHSMPQALLLGIAATAAIWLFFAAIPAWEQLNSPAMGPQHHMADALVLIR